MRGNERCKETISRTKVLCNRHTSKKGGDGEGAKCKKKVEEEEIFLLPNANRSKKKGLGGVSQGSVNYYYPLDIFGQGSSKRKYSTGTTQQIKGQKKCPKVERERECV